MTRNAAIIIGSTGGIGAALTEKLSLNSSFETVLGFSRKTIPAIDVLNEDSIAAAAEHVGLSGLAPTLIIVATGVLHKDERGPEKSLRELDPEWMIENYRLNAVAPALIAKHFLPLMPRSGRVCFAALSARVGSISDNRLGGWYSYRASKAALNMLIRNLSIEWQRKNPEAILVGLHPGTVETGLSAPFKGNPEHERFTPSKAADQLLNVLQTLDSNDSGQLFAYDGHIVAP
jgi:NAD(P)-dependent dehydrogenase (short-subunit alcohol dehydrogenase family)